jgi:hypothetical protein
MTAPAQKVDVARHYLEDALRLYSEARFFSALTLAGAAEEMLGKSLKHVVPGEICGVSLGPVSADEHEVESMFAFDSQLLNIGAPRFTRQSRDEIRKALNRPRNSAKHFNDQKESSFEFDAQFEAGSLLLRAIRNFRMVFPDADDLQYEEESITVDQLNQTLPGGHGEV